MITTASGLQYEDTVPGTGATATAGQRVRVHYTGWLWQDGQTMAETGYDLYGRWLEADGSAAGPPGGTVLDPFVGSGTTAAVALMHGRNAIGIDAEAAGIHRELAELARVRGEFDAAEASAR